MMEIGKIKIGIKGSQITSKTGVNFRPPQKLDHFVIATTERDANGDYIQDVALMEKLKADPRSVKNQEGHLVGIPIRLLYNDPDLNFPTRMAAYVNGRCACEGDGEKAKTRDGRSVPCPCPRFDPKYEGKDKCKINGVLSCMIDGAVRFGGCHRFRSTGLNTASSIIGSMLAIRTATAGLLSGLPLLLLMQPKTTTVPGTGAQTTVYVVSIVYPGTVSELQNETISVKREHSQFLLTMNHIEAEVKAGGCLKLAAGASTDAEDREIAEEFYPQSLAASDDEAIVAQEKPVEAKKETPAPAAEVEVKSTPVEDVEPEREIPISELKGFLFCNGGKHQHRQDVALCARCGQWATCPDLKAFREKVVAAQAAFDAAANPAATNEDSAEAAPEVVAERERTTLFNAAMSTLKANRKADLVELCAVAFGDLEAFNAGETVKVILDRAAERLQTVENPLEFIAAAAAQVEKHKKAAPAVVETAPADEPTDDPVAGVQEAGPSGDQVGTKGPSPELVEAEAQAPTPAAVEENATPGLATAPASITQAQMYALAALKRDLGIFDMSAWQAKVAEHDIASGGTGVTSAKLYSEYTAHTFIKALENQRPT
jgi:hypothetical protein